MGGVRIVVWVWSLDGGAVGGRRGVDVVGVGGEGGCGVGVSDGDVAARVEGDDETLHCGSMERR